jgi:hypothetical protein
MILQRAASSPGGHAAADCCHGLHPAPGVLGQVGKLRLSPCCD